MFGHESLDVYRLSIAYIVWVFKCAENLEGPHRHVRDQWLRAAQTIPLNLAEGNGKASQADRRQYFERARGSVLECAAIQDILVALEKLTSDASESRKADLDRMAAMLTRLGGRGYQVEEEGEEYRADGKGIDSDSDTDSDGNADSTKTKIPFATISSALKAFSFPEADAVVGIREGGVVPAALVAHQLGLPLFLLAINFRAPDNSPRHDEPRLLAEPDALPPAGARVLLVDDVSVSGQTFDCARQCLEDHQVTTFALKGNADLVLITDIEGCVNWPWKAGLIEG